MRSVSHKEMIADEFNRRVFGFAHGKLWAETYHRLTYKTAIPEGKNYIIVTRVNYSTAKLWLLWRNQYYKKGMAELPKVDWLVMIRNFRRDEEQRIKESLKI